MARKSDLSRYFPNTRNAMQGLFALVGKGNARVVDVGENDDNVTKDASGWVVGINENWDVLDYLHRAGHQKYTTYTLSAEVAKHARDPFIGKLAGHIEDARVDRLTSDYFDKDVWGHHRDQIEKLLHGLDAGLQSVSDYPPQYRDEVLPIAGVIENLIGRVAFDLPIPVLPPIFQKFVSYFKNDIVKVRESGSPLDAAMLSARMAEFLGYMNQRPPEDFKLPPPPDEDKSEDEPEDESDGSGGSNESKDESSEDEGDDGEPDENESEKSDEQNGSPSPESADGDSEDESEDDSSDSPEDADGDPDTDADSEDSELGASDSDDTEDAGENEDDESESGEAGESDDDEADGGTDSDSEDDADDESESADGNDDESESNDPDGEKSEGDGRDSKLDREPTPESDIPQSILDELERAAKAKVQQAFSSMARELSTEVKHDQAQIDLMRAHPLDLGRTKVQQTSLGHEYVSFNVKQDRVDTTTLRVRFDLEEERDLSMVRRAKSGLLTPDTWRVVTGKMDVFNKPPLKKGRLVVMVDCSSSMGCPCDLHNDPNWERAKAARTYYGANPYGHKDGVQASWLAWQIAGAICQRFDDALVFAYSHNGHLPNSNTGAYQQMTVISPILPNYKPSCLVGRDAEDVLNGGTPDCVALEYLYDRLMGDVSGAFAIVISDGEPSSPGHDDMRDPRSHTTELAQKFAADGLKYAAVMIRTRDPGIYPAEYRLQVDDIDGLDGVGPMIQEIARNL